MTNDPTVLTRTAFDILKADLEAHGNVLAGTHQAALLELVDTFTAYLTGAEGGRRAFGLPTGMGKTSAVVAFVAAMYRHGWNTPISVAASKVEALCILKRDLTAHGVPEHLIGLKHSLPDASEPSTGSESRQFQLVTHQRVRGGRDFDLFGMHEGSKRPLCIYDETLMRSDVFAFSEQSMRKALALLSIELEKRTDPLSLALLAYLGDASRTITEALNGLRTSGDRHANGVPIELRTLDEHVVQSYRDAVRRACPGLGAWGQELDSLLSISQEALQVLTAQQGGGVVAVREAVPAALRDVVILDASTPIRELIALDPTVTTVQSFDPADLKSYEALQVHQLLAAGGRGAIEWSFTAKTKEARAVSREVIDIVRANTDTAKAFLVFSFLPRRNHVDVLSELKRDLAGAGVDLAARTPTGEPRFQFLTWGNETSLNGYEHCDVVIMAGVLHRSHLDLAAAIKGQVGHLAEPTPSARLRQLVQSEVAHVVLQGASRGSCRRMTDGKAHAMKLYLIHRDAGLKTLLDRVMPGAQWHYPEPNYLKKAAGEGKAAALFGQLMAYLASLESDSVSTQKAKADLGVPGTPADAKAWSRGLDLLDRDVHGWSLVKKSLCRFDYGFTDQT